MATTRPARKSARAKSVSAGSSSQTKPAAAQSTVTYVALLRGINVGGKHSLPMADLRRIFETAGATAVRSYIQSGNVVFAAAPSRVAALIESVEREIRRSFSFDAPVVIRSAAQLRAAIAANPFIAAAAPPAELSVGFLRDRPSASAAASLDPARSPGDSFHLLGCELYLRTPGGMARTKLTSAYFDSRLATIVTVRNWATTLKLLEIVEATH